MSMNLLLKCYDLEATKAFYQDILEFTILDSSNNTCAVEKEDGKIIFTADDLWGEEAKCTGTIYFFVHDVKAYYQQIKDKAIIQWPLQDMPYGTREFGVKDYDGYSLAFAQQI
jgi:uncharacterized glyoxalase superfamily protein PhnB